MSPLLPHTSEPMWATALPSHTSQTPSSRGPPLAALLQGPYLYALCSQDELGDYGRHVLLVIDFVNNILQERLQGSHRLQDDPTAQESMFKHQENQPWSHLQSNGAPSGKSPQWTSLLVQQLPQLETCLRCLLDHAQVPPYSVFSSDNRQKVKLHLRAESHRLLANC